MRYRQFFITLVLIIILAGSSHLMKYSFDDLVFSDAIDDSLTEYGLTHHNFSNETEVFEYYDVIFDELKVNAEEETESIVNQIHLEFELFNSDEKADSFKKTNLIMNFVMKAREIENFIDKLVVFYLEELKNDLIKVGYNESESKNIVDKYRREYVIIWQRNLIIEALDD